MFEVLLQHLFHLFHFMLPFLSSSASALLYLFLRLVSCCLVFKLWLFASVYTLQLTNHTAYLGPFLWFGLAMHRALYIFSAPRQFPFKLKWSSSLHLSLFPFQTLLISDISQIIRGACLWGDRGLAGPDRDG